MRDPVFQLMTELAAERTRQEEEEGFSPEHDDAHDMGELARAAAAYALSAGADAMPPRLPHRAITASRAVLVAPWPLKVHDARRALVIAGALILAELERIDRRDGRQTPLERQLSDYERTRQAAANVAPPAQGTAVTHRCHAIGCDAEVPPALFMCRAHWFDVPKPLRKEVWRTYRRGQEITKDPSREYLAAAKAAIRAVAEKEGRQGSLLLLSEERMNA